ncbi:riboflavin biosynthesis protein RibD [Helicobacter monodelphidis]|uniref:bifunctional diaminohydroxyphosphoribosylaminopyrimidine deaminase/5-amino-6-(5-phosphoribosylamino)uracil reductase RibD n=1 Tax=Helicobacter sp. 15-1451 TaxID=2004995 RepID=UPI000DCF1786|nr:bifunctional diaminohydroxyphosphoribosylaminopyrimidine deaminase/5-amino-6-(5-phosphoribosylamino)uracil reductase RibD [Helicobacter sp. 15-1451]RAX57534.1 riboflavin biosynthesis protein RibD [Helicobacter sp. 15-1451]
MSEDFYFQLALQEAWKYQIHTLPNPAVGALLLDENGKILSIGTHKKHKTMHAELNALQIGFHQLGGSNEILALHDPFALQDYLLKNHQGRFKTCSLFVTLEPCSHKGSTPSCANLLAKLGIQKVWIGTKDNHPLACKGEKILLENGIQTSMLSPHSESLAKNILYPFSCLQNNGQFIFYKYAQRLDGSINGGIISSLESRKKTHEWRGSVDLLVVSGKTVRMDRPILDTRLTPHLKAPDILIITKNKDKIDNNIPLFSVPQRKVFFADDVTALKCLSKIGHYKTAMIEGGSEFLKSCEPFLDMIAVFLAPTFNAHTHTRMSLTHSWVLYHSQQIQDSQDMLLWLGKTDTPTHPL